MGNKSSTKGISRLKDGYLVGGGQAIVSFDTGMPDTATMDVGRINKVAAPVNGGESAEIMYWGAKNDVPQYREELITGNNIVPALIERKRSIICGQAWYAYREKFDQAPDGEMRRIMDEVPIPDEAKAFFKQMKKVGRQVIGELLKHGLAMPSFVRSRDGKILSVKSLETKYIRAQKRNSTGDIPFYWWCNYWTNGHKLKTEEKSLIKLQIYNPDNRQPEFVLPLMDDLFNDGYYPIPAYWGGRHWITLSNIIPLFHEANLKHGASPRFHVIIPHDFFFDYEKMDGAATEEERAQLRTEFKAAEKAFVDDLNKVLTGIGNAGRMVVSKSEVIEALGGRYDKRIIIEEIKFDIRDEALLSLYAASNVANVSAQALHPTLASVETAGKGIGSGTEIRNAFLLYLIIAAPIYRDMLQEIIEVVKFENKWPEDIHYAIRDAEMTTLAENPAGIRPAETTVAA